MQAQVYSLRSRIDELTSEVDATGSRMQKMNAIMKKMTKNKDRGKFCAILVLSLVLVLLCYFVLA